MTTNDNTFPDVADFDVARQQLARRRKLAEQLLQTRFSPEVKFAPNGGLLVGANNPGQTLSNGVDAISGMFESRNLDREEQQLASNEAQQANAMLSSIPASGPERQAALLSAGNRMPSLRNSISALLAADERARENEANRIDKGEQLATDRVSKAESDEKYRRTFAEQMALKQAPTIHVSTGGAGRSGGVKAPSGYRYNEDGTALEPIPGGPADRSGSAAKPLSSPQEKAALELGGEYASMKQLKDSFKDEYSGDLRSSLQREFGKAAGGAAPEATQAMTRWWSDQAMFDELPQRHALFGAALTATEQKSWKDAAISPSLAPSVIHQRLATRQKIYEDAAQRMKASAVAGGKSGQQFDAATGIKPRAQAAPAAQQQSSSPARASLPTVGEVRDGYRYKGGNPKDAANWEAVR